MIILVALFSVVCIRCKIKLKKKNVEKKNTIKTSDITTLFVIILKTNNNLAMGGGSVQYVQSLYTASQHRLTSFWRQTKILHGSLTSAVRTIEIWGVTTLGDIFLKTKKKISSVSLSSTVRTILSCGVATLFDIFLKTNKNFTRGRLQVQYVQSRYVSSQHCAASFWKTKIISLVSLPGTVRTIMPCGFTTLFGINLKTNKKLH